MYDYFYVQKLISKLHIFSAIIGAYYRALPKRPPCISFDVINHPEPTLLKAFSNV